MVMTRDLDILYELEVHILHSACTYHVADITSIYGPSLATSNKDNDCQILCGR